MRASRPKPKVACKACHGRRVKCDRTDRTPCSNCLLANQDCQPIVSRRGKYKRTPGKQSEPHPQNGVPAFNPGKDSNIAHNEDALIQLSHSPLRAPTPQNPNDAKNKVMYFGDSSNFEYVLREMGGPFDDNTRSTNTPWTETIQHLHSNQLSQATKTLLDEQSRKEHQLLQELGALDPFEPAVSDELVRLFFTQIYPASPIFDRADFCSRYEARRISPLVLQGVYFVALAHSSEAVYRRAGFADRYRAAFTCYRRAKALYDANYEADAISSLQAVYLLSHWWGSPMEQKDTWYWTGVAVGLAQSLGLHQQKTYDALSERNRSLWRRIWWSLYIHDISLAVELGRTPHINDAYCSVGMLGEHDFDTEDMDFNAELFGNSSRESSNCFLAIFGANKDDTKVLKSLDSLSSWEAALPAELRSWHSSISLESGFAAPLIQLSYSTTQILLRRNGFNDPERLVRGTVAFDAAVQIVRILEDLISSDTVSLFPLRTLPAAFAAISVHIANMRACRPNVSDVSKHRARLCMLVLKKVQDLWPPLLWYYRLFVRILDGMGCQIPGEEISPRHERAPDTDTDTIRQSTDIQSGSDYTLGVGSHDLMNESFVGDPTHSDFSLPGMTTFFTFASFVDGNSNDGIPPSLETDSGISGL
ncbi:hypothetical protein FQN52_003419 [Onygenales sp. PD_12]|nr:hypothetical protein FQN53_005448 [Emmonsiellopsis sp. PD_33]KAK2792484.1 hypothetical protein FQN52_003419 [Onygenales sp. PD_12]KAK2805164.1 hypothetical protein FQN51_000687 [Onygenales sp. PD_10]